MLPVKFTASVVALLHLVWSAGLTTVGVGSIIKSKEVEVPGQSLAVGVTVIVAVIRAFVEFVAVNEAIFPVPLAGNPIAALVFVQS
jgi:hypothetical protein